MYTTIPEDEAINLLVKYYLDNLQMNKRIEHQIQIRNYSLEEKKVYVFVKLGI